MMCMTVYYCDDGNAEIEIAAANPHAAAKEYVSGGDWGESNETFWITIYVWTGDGDDRVSYTIPVHPDEPKCTKVDHQFKEIYLNGHGGGVIATERCVHCELELTTNTWAQNPQTGEQGLRSIKYEMVDG